MYTIVYNVYSYAVLSTRRHYTCYRIINTVILNVLYFTIRYARHYSPRSGLFWGYFDAAGECMYSSLMRFLFLY